MKRRRLRFHFLIGLAVIMGLVWITACSSNNNNQAEPEAADVKSTAASDSEGTESNLNLSGFPIVKDQITVKMVGVQGTGNPPLDELPLFTEYEKQTNIRINWTSIPSENVTEKKSLIFASNNLPDAFTAGLSDNEVISNGNNGTLIPLEGLIQQYAPNLTKLFQEKPEYRKELTTPEGHIFTLPNINEFSSAQTVIQWINKEWLDKLNLEVPQNKDELYEVLKAFKERDPNGNNQDDEIPFSLREADLELFIGNVFGLLNYNHIMVDNHGKVKPTAMDPRYKEGLQYIRKLYEEKLIDPDLFSLTGAQQNAKGANGQLGAFFHWSIITVGPELEKQYVAFAPLEYGGERATLLKSPLNRGHFAITRAAKEPEALIRWVDYFFSEEGTKMAEFGPKGIGYVDNADGTWQQAPVPEGMTMVQFRESMTTSAGGSMPYYLSSELLDVMGKGEYDNKVLSSASQYNMPYARMAFPNAYMTEEEQKKIAPIRADLDNYVRQMQAKYIMGEASFDDWNAFTETLQSMRIDDLVEVYQEVYDRFQNS